MFIDNLRNQELKAFVEYSCRVNQREAERGRERRRQKEREREKDRVRDRQREREREREREKPLENVVVEFEAIRECSCRVNQRERVYESILGYRHLLGRSYYKQVV